MLRKLYKQLPVLAGLAVFLIALALGKHLLALEKERDHQGLQLRHQAAISLVRAKLEQEVNSTMFLALGLSSFVSATPQFTPAQFEKMAAVLFQQRPAVRNIALAPDNVIRYVYPLQGNQQAMGLRYLDIPEQKSAVLRIMAEKRPIVAGPVELVQGGKGLINRIPIYPLDERGNPYYWGLASVVADPVPMFAAAGFDDPDYEFALRGTDAAGAQGGLICGDRSLFADPAALIMDVFVPGGSWQLAGRPNDKNGSLAAPARFFNLIVWLFALACGALVWLFLRDNLHIRTLALHDPLTGIPNWRYFERMAGGLIAQAKRSGRNFSILHFDLDDFKAINDRYGHKAGDQSLKFVAQQAQQTLREADFIARIGGDEFIALLPDIDSEADLQTLIGRLQAAICIPFVYEGHSLELKVSIGSATFSMDGTTLDDLVKNADRKMYQQKMSNKQTTACDSQQQGATFVQPPG